MKNSPRKPEIWTITRRDFLKSSGFFLAGLSLGTPFALADCTNRKAKLRFGTVTDAHYADTAARGTRFYRESLEKMTECVELMNDKKVDFLVELGDFKDEGEPAAEKTTLKFLETMENIFSRFRRARYHVLGNHDADSISKKQFLARIENTGIAKQAKYYSFDTKGFHFIVLDANFKADGSDYDHGNFDWTDTNIPQDELDWLKNDLASGSAPVIVFVHQQLDGAGEHYVNNADQVRQILQENNRVLAVFQGHNHAGHYSEIEGIHYYTLKAMVEGSGAKNSSYAIVELFDDYSIVVTGYRGAVSKKMEKA
ncbi:MAG: hypothetical protein GXO74_05330 [Calditrichaeota bacterium]|nr:hypothetical protein [Calditrichota bacterium]